MTEGHKVGEELLTESFLSPFRFDLGGGLVTGMGDEPARLALPHVRVERPAAAAILSEGAGLLAHALADEAVADGGLVAEGLAPEVDAAEVVDLRRPRDPTPRLFVGVVGGEELPELGVVH